MTTNISLIEDALRDINVISETQNASAEQGSHALRKLNQMMEVWREEDIDFGWYAQSSTAGTAPVPDYAELAVISGLAIVIAPKYGARITPELATRAESTIRSLRAKFVREGLENKDMTHMPEGSGRYGVRYDINTDQ